MVRCTPTTIRKWGSAIAGDERLFPPTPHPFVRNRLVSAERVNRLEGQPTDEGGTALTIKALLAGREMLLMEVRREKGLLDTEHAHPDHESICYLVSGRMRVVIGGESFIAEPGDSWIHPPGVMHYHETLEDSVQIEAKSPPRKAWL